MTSARLLPKPSLGGAGEGAEPALQVSPPLHPPGLSLSPLFIGHSWLFQQGCTMVRPHLCSPQCCLMLAHSALRKGQVVCERHCSGPMEAAGAGAFSHRLVWKLLANQAGHLASAGLSWSQPRTLFWGTQLMHFPSPSSSGQAKVWTLLPALEAYSC